RGVPEPPHGSDTSIPDSDVAGKPWIARAVDDVPASDEDVVCGALRTKQMCATRGKCNNHGADEESCSHHDHPPRVSGAIVVQPFMPAIGRHSVSGFQLPGRSPSAANRSWAALAGAGKIRKPPKGDSERTRPVRRRVSTSRMPAERDSFERLGEFETAR